MKRLLLLLVLTSALAACNKDKFKTVPQVSIDSFGPAEVRKGDIMQLTATITDQEGDVQDSVTIVKKRYNGSTFLNADTVKVSLRGLGAPAKRKTELRILISYGEIRPEYTQFQNLETFADRNFAVGLIVKDNAGNKSEFVESDKILLKKF